jgi:hypothetical protein
VLRLAPCSSPFLRCTFSIPPALSAVTKLQFAVCYSVLLGGLDQSVQGLCWFLFLGVIGGVHVVCGAHLFVLSDGSACRFGARGSSEGGGGGSSSEKWLQIFSV